MVVAVEHFDSFSSAKEEVIAVAAVGMWHDCGADSPSRLHYDTQTDPAEAVAAAQSTLKCHRLQENTEPAKFRRVMINSGHRGAAQQSSSDYPRPLLVTSEREGTSILSTIGWAFCG
ncbi:UNVERIFIED_CONTAM: hypothetical protein K2H54_061748 [Gekko kuhli]